MIIFELAIALLLVGAVLSLWASRIGVPYPALLALAGAAIALIPGIPAVTLDPELALALFVAPVLLDAAYDASPRDLRDNLEPLINLALVTVLLTVAAVAFVARLIVPDLSWPAAIALGAIVAPPDASAATAVLRRLRPPHRLLVILEGESLFNDATALLIYRLAVTVAVTGVFSGWGVLFTLAITAIGGVFVGWLLARTFLWVTTRIEDIPISVILQFVGTFAIWIIAENLGLSAIITVVAFAMTLARHAPGKVNGRRRIATYAVWEVAVFVLNVLAFLLIGLQLSGILARIAGEDWRMYFTCAVAVCAAVILVRVVWWMSYNAVVRWRIRTFGAHTRRPLMLPTAGSGLVISWAGMRGIVTIAAALALPEDFLYRDLIILAAFCVVVATLVLQGLTLGPLLHRLGLKDDGSVAREVKLAREATARAALEVIERADHRPSAEILRREYEARLQSDNAEESRLATLQREAIAAQRKVLLDLRARAVIGDDAFHAAEEEIDLLDLTADPRVRPDSDS